MPVPSHDHAQQQRSLAGTGDAHGSVATAQLQRSEDAHTPGLDHEQQYVRKAQPIVDRSTTLAVRSPRLADRGGTMTTYIDPVHAAAEHYKLLQDGSGPG